MIPKSVVEIGEGAFKYSQLETLIFADDSALQRIGKYAFAGTRVNRAEIPKALRAAEFAEVCRDLRGL